MMRLVDDDAIESVAPSVESTRQRRDARDLHRPGRVQEAWRDDAMFDAKELQGRGNLLDKLADYGPEARPARATLKDEVAKTLKPARMWRLASMRGPGQSLSEVILRVAASGRII